MTSVCLFRQTESQPDEINQDIFDQALSFIQQDQHPVDDAFAGVFALNGAYLGGSDDNFSYVVAFRFSARCLGHFGQKRVECGCIGKVHHHVPDAQCRVFVPEARGQ